MKFIQKTIPMIYIVMFTIILFILFFYSGVDYYLKRELFIPNLLILLIIVPIFLYYYFCIKETKDIAEKKYYKYLTIISIVSYVLQIILTISIYFYTDWDVKVIREIVNEYMENRSLNNNFYLSLYPNNILFTAILVLIKSIPIFGEHYLFLLGINCILVNLAGIFTSLTIKNITTNKLSLLCFVVMIPLVVLSPWIVIPYTDTFAILFPILIVYLYTKKSRKKIDYYLIGLLSLFGYYIKPTVIITFIAIVIVEFISNLSIILDKSILKQNIKKYMTIVGMVIIGLMTAISLNKLSYKILNFKPMESVNPVTFVHYLSMGQNDQTLGAYSQSDVDDTIAKGEKNNLKKIFNRLTNRGFFEQINFFSKKTLLNFNDGSFSWGLDGTFFYEKTDCKNKFSEILREFYYNDGKYYKLFIQMTTILWIIVLFFCPFIIKKSNTKNEMVLMLSIIGITIFLTIFEPRTRYLYCYSCIFIVTSILGLERLKRIIMEINKKKKI